MRTIIYPLPRWSVRTNSLITDFHNDATATGLSGIEDLLTTNGYTVTRQQLIKDWVVALAVGGEITKGAVVNGLSQDALEIPFLPQSKINWNTSQAYSNPGAPNNGADFVRLRDADEEFLGASKISSLSFIGAPVYPTRPVEWIEEPLSLYSGMEDQSQRGLVRQIEVPANGAISLDLSWDIEAEWDFFYVQIFDETTSTLVSLLSQNTTYESRYPDDPNLPGLTSSSYGEILKQKYDATPYAGQTVSFALVYITDAATLENGVRLYGMQLDGVEVADALDLSAWRSLDVVIPTQVEEWHVALVAYTPDGDELWANTIPLVDSEVTLAGADLEALIGTDASIVSALVTVIDSSESIVDNNAL